MINNAPAKTHVAILDCLDRCHEWSRSALVEELEQGSELLDDATFFPHEVNDGLDDLVTAGLVEVNRDDVLDFYSLTTAGARLLRYAVL